ncbi:MAG: hypothetical protein ACREOM_15060 [Candidatus Dormibacteraceae bacterium]
MLQLMQNDPSAVGQMAFVWLSAAAIGLGYYASRIPPRITPADLQRIHREIDDCRRQIGEATHQGGQVQDLEQHLERLRERLPPGDARRSEKILKT